jgi:hypothetical protein
VTHRLPTAPADHQSQVPDADVAEVLRAVWDRLPRVTRVCCCWNVSRHPRPSNWLHRRLTEQAGPGLRNFSGCSPRAQRGWAEGSRTVSPRRSKDQTFSSCVAPVLKSKYGFLFPVRVGLVWTCHCRETKLRNKGEEPVFFCFGIGTAALSLRGRRPRAEQRIVRKWGVE